jgi:hypothetical protein
MMKLTSLALLLVGVLCSGWLFCCQAGEAEFNVLVEKMERDVLEPLSPTMPNVATLTL